MVLADTATKWFLLLLLFGVLTGYDCTLGDKWRLTGGYAACRLRRCASLCLCLAWQLGRSAIILIPTVRTQYMLAPIYNRLTNCLSFFQ